MRTLGIFEMRRHPKSAAKHQNHIFTVLLVFEYATMPPLDPTIRYDIFGKSSERGEEAIMNLAQALSENWLNPETVLSMIDTHNGMILYDDFFDCMHQFGLGGKIDLETAFNHVAKEEDGLSPSRLIVDLRTRRLACPVSWE